MINVENEHEADVTSIDPMIGGQYESSSDEDENWSVMDIENENKVDVILNDPMISGQYESSSAENEDEDENWPKMDIVDENAAEDENINNENEHEMTVTSNIAITQRGGGGAGNESSLIDILSKNRREYKKLNASGLRLEVKFRPPTSSNIAEWAKLCIDDLLLIIQRELYINRHERVGLIFSNTNNTRVDFSISYRPFSQYDTESILSELEKVIQSNTTFFTDDNLIINIDHVRIPVGYGQRREICR